jgi:signal peptidase I
VNDADPMELLRAARERVERVELTAADAPPTATVPRTVHDDSGEPTPDEPEPSEGRRSALDSVEATGERRRRRRHSATRNAVEWVIVLIGALVVALVVKTFLFQAFYIPSSSMEPTLQVGDRVLVNKVSYDIDDVDRGDIVVFERPDTWGAGDIDDLIKRVIGLPGDRIAVVDGVIQIDGEPLDEPWLPDGVTTPSFFNESGCVPECTVPEGFLFVLGDNRGNSDASNHFGPLDFEQVVGRAFVRVWPIGDIGGL